MSSRRFKKATLNLSEVGEGLERDLSHIHMPHLGDEAPEVGRQMHPDVEPSEPGVHGFVPHLSSDALVDEVKQMADEYVQWASRQIPQSVMEGMEMIGSDGSTVVLSKLMQKGDVHELADLFMKGYRVKSFLNDEAAQEFHEIASGVSESAHDAGDRMISAANSPAAADPTSDPSTATNPAATPADAPNSPSPANHSDVAPTASKGNFLSRAAKLMKVGKYLLMIGALFGAYQYFKSTPPSAQEAADGNINPVFTGDPYGMNSAGEANGMGQAATPQQQYTPTATPQFNNIQVQDLPNQSSDPFYSPNMDATSLNANSSKRFLRTAQEQPATPPVDQMAESNLKQVGIALQRTNVPSFHDVLASISAVLGADFSQLPQQEQARRLASPEVEGRLNILMNKYNAIASTAQRLMGGLDFSNEQAA